MHYSLSLFYHVLLHYSRSQLEFTTQFVKNIKFDGSLMFMRIELICNSVLNCY